MLPVTTSALCDVCDWCRMTGCVLPPVVLVARAAVYVCMACVSEVVQHCTMHQYIATTAICFACATSCGSLHELVAGAASDYIYSVCDILCITACCIGSQ